MGPVHLSPAKGTGLYLWSIFPPVCIFLGHSGILGTRVSWHLVGRTHHALGGNPSRPEHSPSPFAAAAAVGGVPVSHPPPLPCSCSFRAGAVICLFTSVSSFPFPFPFRRFSPSVSPPVSSKPKASSPLTFRYHHRITTAENTWGSGPFSAPQFSSCALHPGQGTTGSSGVDGARVQGRTLRDTLHPSGLLEWKIVLHFLK